MNQQTKLPRTGADILHIYWWISWIPRPVAMNFVVTMGIVVIVGDCVQWEQIMSILSWVTIVVNHGWHHHYSYIMFYIQYNSYSVFLTFTSQSAWWLCLNVIKYKISWKAYSRNLAKRQSGVLNQESFTTLL